MVSCRDVTNDALQSQSLVDCTLTSHTRPLDVYTVARSVQRVARHVATDARTQARRCLDVGRRTTDADAGRAAPPTQPSLSRPFQLGHRAVSSRYHSHTVTAHLRHELIIVTNESNHTFHILKKNYSVKIRYMPRQFELFPIDKTIFFAKLTNTQLEDKHLKLFRSALLSYICLWRWRRITSRLNRPIYRALRYFFPVLYTVHS